MPSLPLPSLSIDDDAASALPAVSFALLAGEADQFVLSDIAARDLIARDLLLTLAIMCAPNDDTWLQTNNALTDDELYHVLRHAEQLDLEVSLSGEVALNIADRRDVRALIAQMIRKDWLAHIASGYMLRWIVSRWRRPETRADASLGRAATVFEEWCKKHRITGGGEQHITRNMWPKYKSVSHLWAAFYTMKDADIDIATEEGFVSFCSTAQWLLEEGAKIVPKGRRAGETILTLDEAWSVPASHIRRAVYRDTGADAGIVAVWNDELGAHDIRETNRPPSMDKPV